MSVSSRVSSRDEIVLRCALSYARKGWQVFPLAGNTKVPPRGFSWPTRASNEAKEIKALFREHPGANIGIVTGSKSRLVVLDVDPRNGGLQSLASLQSKIGPLPNTLRAQTPSGGEHWYFRFEGEVPTSASKLGPGLDIRAQGGYVAARPSLVGGKKYRWKKKENIAELPEELLALLRRRTPTNVGEHPSCIPEGRRDDVLFQSARSLYDRGLSHAEVLEAVTKLNTEKCTPPLPQSAIARICRPPERTSRGSSPPVVEDYADLAKRELPKLRYAVRQLLPEGVGILVGPPKIGKSFLVLQVALSIVLGAPLWKGRKAEREGKVLYLAYEDSDRRLRKRVELLSRRASVPKNKLNVSRSWPKMDEGGVEAIDQWLTENPGTRLVVIDTLERFRASKNLKHSVYAFDYSVGATLEPIASRHRVAILLVHHTSKGPRSDIVDSINGTNGLAGSVDTIWVLKADRGAEDASLFVTGRDIEQPDSLNLKLDKTTRRWEAVGTMAEAKMSAIRKQILKDLQTYGPSTPQQISKRIHASGNIVRQRLLRMRAAGQVAADGQGRYSTK